MRGAWRCAHKNKNSCPIAHRNFASVDLVHGEWTTIGRPTQFRANACHSLRLAHSNPGRRVLASWTVGSTLTLSWRRSSDKF